MHVCKGANTGRGPRPGVLSRLQMGGAPLAGSALVISSFPVSMAPPHLHPSPSSLPRTDIKLPLCDSGEKGPEFQVNFCQDKFPFRTKEKRGEGSSLFTPSQVVEEGQVTIPGSSPTSWGDGSLCLAHPGIREALQGLQKSGELGTWPWIPEYPQAQS